MIWQVPEVYEILEFLKIEGFVMTSSGIICLALFFMIMPIIGPGIDLRQNNKAVRHVLFMGGCLKRGLIITFWGINAYTFGLLLLIFHPNVMIAP